MDFLLTLLPIAYVVFAIILLYQIFTLFNRVNEIKKSVVPNYEKMYWIERKLGNNDKAYEYLIRDYIDRVYRKFSNNEKYILSDIYRKKLEKACNELGKPIPNYKELEKRGFE